MLCSYCNADLKPEDIVCPVCGKPVDGIGNVVNQNVNNIPEVNDISKDVMGEFDQSLFEPLPEMSTKVENVTISDEQPVIEEIPLVSEVDSMFDVNEPQVVEQQSLVNENVSTVETEEPEVFEAPVMDVQPPLVDNYVNVNSHDSSDYETKKHKSNLWMIPIILIIFLVAILGFAFYIFRSPKMIFNALINKTYWEINDNIATDVKNMKGSMSLETNISSSDESSNGIFEILNNIYISADYEIDYENKTVFTKINTKYDNEKLVDLDVYLNDSKGYVLFKDVYDKYLSTDIDGFDEMFEKVKITEDYKVVISGVKKALNKSLKSEYFTSEKTSLKINNKEVAATKNSLGLTEEVINNIGKEMITDLKSDDKFITSLSNISEINKGEILSSMEEALKSLESTENSSGETMIISIYTEGLIGDVVKYEVEMSSEGEKSVVELTKESEDVYGISVIGAGTTVTGSIKLLDDDKVEISLTEPTTKTTIGLTIGASIEHNEKLTKVDVSNSVSADEITEDELTQIETKLMESKGIQNLMNAINSLDFGFGYESDDYYDDFNDDFGYYDDFDVLY